MEWIRISPNKLKIMLNAQDARHYALDCASADYTDVVTRAAFREILSDVEAETGFDAGEDKLYIQMYPSKDGGCELFVTRIGLLLTEPEQIQKKPHNGIEKGHTMQLSRKRSNALCFDRFDHLLALCRRLAPYAGESEAWQDENHIWWLILTETGDPLTLSEDHRFMREYGHAHDAVAARVRLKEHGRLICSHRAVEALAEL